MKLLDKLTKKVTEKVSSVAKDEVKKKAIGLIPGAVAIAGVVAGVLIFRRTTPAAEVGKALTRTTVTTNNYFFKDLSEEMIRTIIEEGKR